MKTELGASLPEPTRPGKMTDDAQKDFADMVTNFHKGVIPVVGAVSAGMLFMIALLVHWKGHVGPLSFFILSCRFHSFMIGQTFPDGL